MENNNKEKGLQKQLSPMHVWAIADMVAFKVSHFLVRWLTSVSTKYRGTAWKRPDWVSPY